jgi:hypothetical protein
MLFIAIIFSPLLMVLVAFIFVWIAKLAKFKKANMQYLIGHTIIYAAIGAGATLIFTIAWMIWYETTTGYSAGNGPLAWIFLYGPAGASLGQLIALIVWWFKKPIETANEIKS